VLLVDGFNMLQKIIKSISTVLRLLIRSDCN